MLDRFSEISWQIDQSPILYEDAFAIMEQRALDIIANKNSELIWITEHPPVYTAGISAKPEEILNHNIPVFQTNRGGKYTYHGPGVKIIYVMLNLKKLFYPKPPDVRIFVRMLENWIIAILAKIGIKGETRKDRIGIWVCDRNGAEKKIAAIGIKLKKWVSYHGIAINVNPDLKAFQGIIPCGISNFGVTSVNEVSTKGLPKLNQIIKKEFGHYLLRPL
ncbi:lipoyl(octanoyl) transferase LipB [Flavobacteriaceae bacterium]|nr:lipoyl(octanoyl) transferase LipB [Flavobacteriaceae bacterium]